MQRNVLLRILNIGLSGCLCLPCLKGLTQIRSNWFDINPSSSSLYKADPNGSSGGRVNHLGASSDMRRVFAASEWGGLWTSFTQGLTWVKVNSFVPSATWDVKVDPSNTDRLRVYVTSFYDGKINTIVGPAGVSVRNSKSGISISSDGGNTWSNAPLPTLNCAVASRQTEPSAWQIAISPKHANMLFVGTNCGLARSFDFGGSWTYVDPSPGDNAEQIYTVIAQGDSIVDVIGDNGHFRSTNAGTTWTAVPGPAGVLPGGAPGPASSLAASPAENYVLFATNGGSGGNIFESDDGGQTWPTSLTSPTNTIRAGVPNEQGRVPFVKTNQRITSNQFDLWFGDVNLFSATCTTPPNPAPGGAPRAPLNSWALQQTGSHWDVADVLLNPGAQSDACPLLFANDGGIYRNQGTISPACQTANWQEVNATHHATWIWNFAGTPSSQPGTHDLYYGLQDDGNWGTVNAHEGPVNPVPSWTNDICCDIFSEAAQADRSMYVSGFFNTGKPFRLFVTSPDLSSSNQIPNYPSLAGTLGTFSNAKGVVPFGPKAFALAQSDGVYITNDITTNPISWTSLGAPTSPNSTIGGAGNLRVSNVGGPTSIYYHTGAGNPNNTGQIFRRGLPAGSAWQQLPLPVKANINAVTVYDVDPNNGNNLVICGIDGANNFSMWKTNNFGTNWTPLSNLDNLMLGGIFKNNTANGPTNFESFGTYWQPFMVQIDPNDGNTMVVGAADAGIFVTTDFGNNWKLVTNPINPSSTDVHIARPLFAYFSPTRFTPNSQAFDVWIATQGSGVQKVLVESP
jgi:photosystem II stability/assembly factor-like uncharacterized protein